MNMDTKKLVITADSALESLLEQATPRPVPPTDDEKAVRAAVYEEWSAITRKRKVRRHLLSYAAAATVLLAVTVSYNSMSGLGEPAAQVATIEKSFGSIYMLGEQSELREMTDVLTISAGQKVVTGDDSGMGLAWGQSGSLRIDQNTRIEFLSPTSVFLRSGRLYFDSEPIDAVAAIAAIDAGSASGLEIHTAHGVVTHLGTQYMTAVEKDRLSVSVRDGQVSISGVLYPAIATEGEQLNIVGSARPYVTNIAGYGDAWKWIESTTPAKHLDGRTVDEFLQWVCHETGMEVYWDSTEAELLAKEVKLMGDLKTTEPTEALRIWMATVDFKWSIDDGLGFIHVSH